MCIRDRCPSLHETDVASKRTFFHNDVINKKDLGRYPSQNGGDHLWWSALEEGYPLHRVLDGMKNDVLKQLVACSRFWFGNRLYHSLKELLLTQSLHISTFHFPFFYIFLRFPRPHARMSLFSIPHATPHSPNRPHTRSKEGEWGVAWGILKSDILAWGQGKRRKM